MNKLLKSYLIFGLIGFFAFLYSFIAITKYLHFQTGLDLAIYVQTFWFYIHLLLPRVTLYPTYGDIVWTDHFSPSLFLFTPFYLLFRDPRILLIFQSVFLCFGAYPLFRFTREYLESTILAFALTFVYLVSFTVQYPLTFDFHMATIAAAFLPWILWSMFREKWKTLIFLSILASGFKEDMSIYIAAIGIYLFISRKKWKLGLCLAVIGTAYVLYITKILMPSLASAAVKTYYFPYLELNSNFFISVLFDSPIKQTTMLFSFINYLLLPFLSGSFFFLPVIHFFINFANHDFPERWGLYMHYRSYLGPILAFATVIALKNLMKIKPKIFNISRTKVLFSIVFVANALFLDIYLHLPLNTLLKKQFYYDEPWIADNNSVIKQIPVNAYLLTTNHLFPQTAFREHIFEYPKNLQKAEYILLDIRKNQPAIDYWLTAGNEVDYQSKIARLLETNALTITAKSNEIILLKRNFSIDISDFRP